MITPKKVTQEEKKIAQKALGGISVTSLANEYRQTRGKITSAVNRFCRESNPQAYVIAESESRDRGWVPVSILRGHKDAFLKVKPIKLTIHSEIDQFRELNTQQKNILKREGVKKLADIKKRLLKLLELKIDQPSHCPLAGIGVIGAKKIINVYNKYSKINLDKRCK